MKQRRVIFLSLMMSFLSFLSLPLALGQSASKDSDVQIFIGGKKFKSLQDYREQKQKSVPTDEKTKEDSALSPQEDLGKQKDAIKTFLATLGDPENKSIDPEKLKTLLTDLKKEELYKSLSEEEKPLDQQKVKEKLEDLLKDLETSPKIASEETPSTPVEQKQDISGKTTPSSVENGTPSSDLPKTSDKVKKPSWTVETIDRNSLKKSSPKSLSPQSKNTSSLKTNE